MKTIIASVRPLPLLPLLPLIPLIPLLSAVLLTAAPAAFASETHEVHGMDGTHGANGTSSPSSSSSSSSQAFASDNPGQGKEGKEGKEEKEENDAASVSHEDSRAFVGSLTKRVEEAVKTGNLSVLVKNENEGKEGKNVDHVDAVDDVDSGSGSGTTSSSPDSGKKNAKNDAADVETVKNVEKIPSIPARYLRPDAVDADKTDRAERTKALAALKQQADAVDASNASNASNAAARVKSDVKSGEKSGAASKNDRRSNSYPYLTPREFSKVSINLGRVIAMKPGDNVFIPISREHPNRLLTPFSNPQIISTTLKGGNGGKKDNSKAAKSGESGESSHISSSAGCGEVCVRNGVIYVTTDSTSAVTAFITETGHEEIAFSVTMVPQAIPPREVRFTLPDEVVEEMRSRRNKARVGAGAGAGAGRLGNHSMTMTRAQAWEVSHPYVETLKNAMRSVALGQVPDGYTLRNVRSAGKGGKAGTNSSNSSNYLPRCTHPGLSIDFTNGQVMEGFNLDIYAGVITNISDRPVEFRNQNCGSWRNAAVTSWPLTLLKPGQKTEIYIAVKREEEVPPDTVRQPLIEREFN